ncbi:MAG: glycosyltransferase [Chloroflexi bacterium]|nr:glycosyltransferase [Chloroflexota bacterium]
MKIGLVTDFYFPWIGGPSILIRNLGHGLVARGHCVSLLAPSPTGSPYTEDDGGMKVTRLRTLKSPFGYDLRVAPFPVGGAGRWLDTERPDVVHFHHPFPLSAATVMATRRRGVPLVATNHTVPQCTLWGIRGSPLVYASAAAAFGRWLTMLMRQCDAAATPTDTAAELLREAGFSGNIRTISNGIDTSRFSPGPASLSLRTALGLNGNPIVLYTGRLDAEKEMGVWLRAAALVDRAVPVQFVVGGTGADRERIESLAAELGLGDRVRFIGYVSDNQLPDLYRLASVYFITSQVELQSISTLEAVACGIPVVAVRAGALPELVHDGVNGLLVPPGDFVLAALALETLLAGERLRAEMGHAGRQIGLGHALSATLDAYEDFLLDASRRRVAEPCGERLAAVGQ